MLSISSNMVLNPTADPMYFGCPSVCCVPTGPRCTIPRQLDSPIAQFAKNTIQTFPNKSLEPGEPCTPCTSKKNWLATNPENLGPSVSLFQNLPFPTHFRSCGIAPTRLNQSAAPDDLFDPPTSEPESEQSSSEDSWRPDSESSTQGWVINFTLQSVFNLGGVACIIFDTARLFIFRFFRWYPLFTVEDVICITQIFRFWYPKFRFWKGIIVTPAGAPLHKTEYFF